MNDKKQWCARVGPRGSIRALIPSVSGSDLVGKQTKG